VVPGLLSGGKCAGLKITDANWTRNSLKINEHYPRYILILIFKNTLYQIYTLCV